MKKEYTTFEEIDEDLEILKLEREIRIRKMGLSVERITNQLSPGNLAKKGISGIASTFQSSSGLKSAVITFIIKFIFNRLSKSKSN